MKTSFASILAAVSLIAGAVAAPAPGTEVRRANDDKCAVQVRIIDSWNEAGMRRFRYAFTSNKDDYWGLGSDGSYGSYSDISIDIRNAINDAGKSCSSVRRNLQGPWWSDDEQAYLADMSEVQGIAGYSISDCTRQVTENNWKESSGCDNRIV